MEAFKCVIPEGHPRRLLDVMVNQLHNQLKQVQFTGDPRAIETLGDLRNNYLRARHEYEKLMDLGTKLIFDIEEFVKYLIPKYGKIFDPTKSLGAYIDCCKLVNGIYDYVLHDWLKSVKNG